MNSEVSSSSPPVRTVSPAALRLYLLLGLMAGLSGSALAEETESGASGDTLFLEGDAPSSSESFVVEAIPLTPGHLDFGGDLPGWTAEIGTSLSYENDQVEGDGESALLSSTDLSLGYQGKQDVLFQPIVEFNYNLAYYHYWEDSLNDGRDPLENSVDGRVGIRGSKTSVFLRGSFFQNNGYGGNIQRLDRESQLSTSENFQTGINIARKLGRTSLSADIRYRLQNFLSDDEQSGLSDLTEWDGTLSWAFTAPQAPKLEFRPSIGVGTSSQDSGSDQSYWNPYLALNYLYSGKTSLFANVGADFREGTVVGADGGEQTFDQTTPTYGLGGSWQPAPGTLLSADLYRRSSSSALQGRGSTDTTGFSVKGTKRFLKNYSASINYSYERASYSDVADRESRASSGSTGTPAKNFQRFGADIGRQFQLRSRLNLNASLFYQYSLSDGEDLESDLERSMLGIRLSLGF